tara:strand:+ start:319 stop:882 length:564 start_codon:yes stop_codon:yes gene_type:complete
MSSIVSMQKKPVKRRGKSLWMKNVLTRTIILPFKSVGGNIIQIIKKKLENTLYNKCCPEGYIKQASINILTYSSGEVKANNVCFSVMFECLICRPVEGQVIKVKAKNITKAGIRAIYDKEEISPITVFIARDHHYNSLEFSKVKSEDDITIKVIGIRYELNDENISVLGELRIKKKKSKTKVTIVEE